MSDHFPLSSAYLCVDCHAVGNNSGGCPACASRNVMSLANVLERPQREPSAWVQQTIETLDEVTA